MNRRCLVTGCRNYAVGGESRCEPHRLAVQRARRARRDPDELRFYGSKEWQALRAETLADAGWRCETRCTDGRICGEFANTAGHRIPWRVRPDLGLSPDNVSAQCRRHQNLAQNRAPGVLMPR